MRKKTTATNYPLFTALMFKSKVVNRKVSVTCLLLMTKMEVNYQEKQHKKDKQLNVYIGTGMASYFAF